MAGVVSEVLVIKYVGTPSAEAPATFIDTDAPDYYARCSYNLI
jgi:hypothetical protein